MHFEPLPQEEIGTLLGATEHFHQHFQQYEQQFLEHASAHGYPSDLWPYGAFFVKSLVHRALVTGVLPETIPISNAMARTQYSGPKLHELVVSDFNRDYPLFQNAVFVLTKGEDWWPYEKTFIAEDANSFMLYCLYRRACSNKEVLTEQPKRGRPRNEAAHAARAQRSERYQKWLADCEAYRTRQNELKEAYLKALAEYTEWKERGAPKWIP